MWRSVEKLTMSCVLSYGFYSPIASILCFHSKMVLKQVRSSWCIMPWMLYFPVALWISRGDCLVPSLSGNSASVSVKAVWWTTMFSCKPSTFNRTQIMCLCTLVYLITVCLSDKGRYKMSTFKFLGHDFHVDMKLTFFTVLNLHAFWKCLWTFSYSAPFKVLESTSGWICHTVFYNPRCDKIPNSAHAVWHSLLCI